MKKIVMGIAAVAMAASLFAADVAGKVKLNGSLFNFDGASEEVTAIKIGHNTDESWNPVLAMSVNTDLAGAETSIYVGPNGKKMGDWNTGYELGIKTWKIWFKPLDVLTVRVGSIDASMNTETIDWSNRVLNYDNYGYKVEYAQDALTIALGLVPGTDSLFKNDTVAKNAALKKLRESDAYKAMSDSDKKKAEEDALKTLEKAAETDSSISVPEAYLGEVNLFAQYAADFGTIKAMFDFQNTFKSNTFAVGYNNTFDALTMFADVALTTKEVKRTSKKDAKVAKQTDIGLAIDAFAAYTVDALTAKLYVKGTIGQLNNISKDYGAVNSKGDEYNVGTLPGNIACMIIARADYKLDPVNVYAYFKSADVLKKAKVGDDKDPTTSVFESTIKAGLNGSVGICNWDACLQLDTGKGAKYDKVNVAVPVEFTVNF